MRNGKYNRYGSSEIYAYYLGYGKSEPDSYEQTSSIRNLNGYELMLNPQNTSKDQFLRIQGQFNMYGFHIGGIINIDDKIRYNQNNRNLFAVSIDKINNDSYIVITVPEEFEIKYNLFPKLTMNYGQGYSYQADFDSDLSTKRKMVFKLGLLGTESLIPGGNYVLELDYIDLLFVPEDLSINSNYYSDFKFAWTY